MSVWGETFLGVIAFATLVTASVQVGAMLYAIRLAKRLDKLTQRVEHEISPVITKLTIAADDAARASALAVSQMQRIDGMLIDLSKRVDYTLAIIQSFIVTPAREGAAVLGAIRAMLKVLGRRGSVGKRPSRVEGEDALFIG